MSIAGLPPDILAALLGGPPPPPLMPPAPPGLPMDPMAGGPPVPPEAAAIFDEMVGAEEDVPDPDAGAIEQNPMGLLEPPHIPNPRSEKIKAYIKDFKLRPAEKQKKPKVDWIVDERKRREEHWQLRNNRMDRDLDLYLLDGVWEYPDKETGQEKITRVTPRATVDKLSYMVGRQKDKIEVKPRANGPKWKDAAQSVEDFLYTLRREANAKHQTKLNMSLGRDEAWYAAVRGWIVSRVYLEPDEEFPICIELFDPRHCYPAMGASGQGMLRNMIVYEATDVATFLNKNSWAADHPYLEDMDGESQIEFTWYEDEYYSIVLVDDVVVKSVEHGYGFCPWAVSICGGAPVDNDQTRGQIGSGILTPLRATFKQMDRMLSKLTAGVTRYGDPPTKSMYDSEKQGTAPAQLDINPGANTEYDTGKGQDGEIVQVPAPPLEVQLLWEALNDDIAKAGLVPVLWGTAEGLASGFHQAVATNAAEDALFPVTDCIIQQRQWQNRLSLLEVLVAQKNNVLVKDNVPEPDEDGYGDVAEGIPYTKTVKDKESTSRPYAKKARTVVGILTPEDITNHGVDNEVRLRRMTPQDIMTMVQAGAMAVQANLLSVSYVRSEWLDVDDPVQMNLDIIYEFIYKDEEMMQEIFMPLALKADPDIYDAYMKKHEQRRREEAMMKSGMMGMSGAPPPNIPGIPSELLPPQLQAAGIPQSPEAMAALMPEMPGTIPPY